MPRLISPTDLRPTSPIESSGDKVFQSSVNLSRLHISAAGLLSSVNHGVAAQATRGYDRVEIHMPDGEVASGSAIGGKISLQAAPSQRWGSFEIRFIRPDGSGVKGRATLPKDPGHAHYSLAELGVKMERFEAPKTQIDESRIEITSSGAIVVKPGAAKGFETVSVKQGDTTREWTLKGPTSRLNWMQQNTVDPVTLTFKGKGVEHSVTVELPKGGTPTRGTPLSDLTHKKPGVDTGEF